MANSTVISIRLRNAILEAVEDEAARQHRDRNNIIEFWLMEKTGVTLERPRNNSGQNLRKPKAEPTNLDPEVEDALVSN